MSTSKPPEDVWIAVCLVVLLASALAVVTASQVYEVVAVRREIASLAYSQDDQVRITVSGKVYFDRPKSSDEIEEGE